MKSIDSWLINPSNKNLLQQKSLFLLSLLCFIRKKLINTHLDDILIEGEDNLVIIIS